MSSSHAKPTATTPAYTRQSVSEFSSLRRRPVIMISRNMPLAASSTTGATTATVTKLVAVCPGLIADSM